MHAAVQHVEAMSGQILGCLKALVRRRETNTEEVTKTTQVLVQVASRLLS